MNDEIAQLTATVSKLNNSIVQKEKENASNKDSLSKKEALIQRSAEEKEELVQKVANSYSQRLEAMQQIESKDRLIKILIGVFFALISVPLVFQ